MEADFEPDFDPSSDSSSLISTIFGLSFITISPNTLSSSETIIIAVKPAIRSKAES